MNEDARIRYEQEKKPFFYREFQYSEPDQILVIKTPDIFVGEIAVPQNKENSDRENRREIGFPMLNEVHPFPLKTEEERN